MLRHRRGHRRLLGQGAVPQGGAADGRPAAHQGQQVELDLAPGSPHSDDHDPSSDRHQGHGGGHPGPTDQFERHVVGTVPGHLLGPDDQVGPQAADVVTARLRPHRRHHLGPGGVGQLHRGGAHAAGRPRDQDPVPDGQSGLGEQGVVGRAEGLGEAAGLGPGEALRHREQGRLGHGQQFGLAPTADEGHDPVTQPEAAGPRAQADHLAGQLHARDVRRPPRRGGIEPLPLDQVGGVEAGGGHGHQHLPRSGLRVGVLAPLERALHDGHRVHSSTVDGVHRADLIGCSP